MPERFRLMFGLLDANRTASSMPDEALTFVKANGGGRGFGGGRRGGDRERRLQQGGGVREKPASQAETPAAP